MEIKHVKPINFLLYSTDTTVGQLSQYVARVARALHLEAAKLSLDVTGPIYWEYTGFNGDPACIFRLEIGIPVAEIPAQYTGIYSFQRKAPFKCLATIHEGAWLELPRTYEKLMRYLTHHQLRPTVHNREVYINCDYQHPEANITEVQIGIE